MRARSMAGVDAPAFPRHRVHRWTGLGWWRRKAWVQHDPNWRVIATSTTTGGMVVELCYGDDKCTETRIVRAPGLAA